MLANVLSCRRSPVVPVSLCEPCQVCGGRFIRDLAGLVPNGTLPKDYQYTGQRNETSLGIYDYKARFYSPYLGRFLSADTLVPEVGGQHLSRYMYVRGNPVGRVDPDGHMEVDDGRSGMQGKSGSRASGSASHGPTIIAGGIRLEGSAIVFGGIDANLDIVGFLYEASQSFQGLPTLDSDFDIGFSVGLQFGANIGLSGGVGPLWTNADDPEEYQKINAHFGGTAGDDLLLGIFDFEYDQGRSLENWNDLCSHSLNFLGAGEEVGIWVGVELFSIHFTSAGWVWNILGRWSGQEEYR